MGTARKAASEQRFKLHLRCRGCQSDTFQGVSFGLVQGVRAQQRVVDEAIRSLFFACCDCPSEQAVLIAYTPEENGHARPHA